MAQQVNLLGEKVDRETVKEKLGFLPLSIWNIDNQKSAKLKKELLGVEKYYSNPKDLRCFYNATKRDWYSIFSPLLSFMILKAYAPEKARIFDPFAVPSRALTSCLLGHEYFGINLSDEQIAEIKKLSEKHGVSPVVKKANAMEYIKDPVCNFSFTCPPYYNLEQYSNQEWDDLSALPSYTRFLKYMGRVIENIYKSLEPLSFFCCVVGNFRDKKGDLIHFNGDFVHLAKEVGFKLHDEIILNTAPAMASKRVGFFLKNKRSVRIHEYLLIFRKGY